MRILFSYLLIICNVVFFLTIIRTADIFLCHASASLTSQTIVHTVYVNSIKNCFFVCLFRNVIRIVFGVNVTLTV